VFGGLRLAQKLGNKRVWQEQSTFMACDLLIYSAYQGEILDRQLPALMFPRTTRAARAVNAEIRETEARILDAMTKGSLH
jgi:hypothetical protein